MYEWSLSVESELADSKMRVCPERHKPTRGHWVTVWQSATDRGLRQSATLIWSCGHAACSALSAVSWLQTEYGVGLGTTLRNKPRSEWVMRVRLGRRAVDQLGYSLRETADCATPGRSADRRENRTEVKIKRRRRAKAVGIGLATRI